MTLDTRTITVIHAELVWIFDDGMYRTIGFLEPVFCKPAHIDRCALRGANLGTFLYHIGDMEGDVFLKMIRWVQGPAFFGADLLTSDALDSVVIDDS